MNINNLEGLQGLVKDAINEYIENNLDRIVIENIDQVRKIVAEYDEYKREKYRTDD